MAKGMKVNRPKTSLQKNLQKLNRVNKQKRKKQKLAKTKTKAFEEINKDPLITSNMLKKRRTNPQANITLSGKKRRLLIKKHKKANANAMKMEAETTDKKTGKARDETQTVKNSEKMDID